MGDFFFFSVPAHFTLSECPLIVYDGIQQSSGNLLMHTKRLLVALVQSDVAMPGILRLQTHDRLVKMAGSVYMRPLRHMGFFILHEQTYQC